MNAIVFMDYENISERLKKYGKDPLEIDFFQVIQGKLKEAKLNIIDFIVYGNFEKKTLNPKQQTFLRTSGIQTRHTANNGKSSADLELTVEALRVLFKNPSINIFVIISSERDVIPLLKAIKYENKVSYVISTRQGFNQIVAGYADFHEYIEEIFGLTAGPAEAEVTEKNPEIEKAVEVTRLFYESRKWSRYNSPKWIRYIQLETPERRAGDINRITAGIKRFFGWLFNDFKVARSVIGFISTSVKNWLSKRRKER
ncbi:MAG TPA: NYN domain-containing protein [Bacillota bacterium]|nr:NYN domain-containing protein [Bacillota bacterium]